jgi:hypothetical protein
MNRVSASIQSAARGIYSSIEKKDSLIIGLALATLSIVAAFFLQRSSQKLPPFPRKEFLSQLEEDNIRQITETWCDEADGKHTGFCLFRSEESEYVLKKSGINTLRARHQNLLKAQRICDAYGLDRLVIPHSKLLEYQEGTQAVLVEECLCLDEQERQDIAQKGILCLDSVGEGLPTEDLFQRKTRLDKIQGPLFKSDLNELDSVFKQLTSFIVISGYWDAHFRNNPILYSNGEFYMGLYDLEDLSQDQTSLFEHVKSVFYGIKIFQSTVSERHAMLIKIETVKQAIFSFFQATSATKQKIN